LSITANFEEGFSRNSNLEKARFINISYSSCVEAINFLILSMDLKLISEEKYVEIRKSTESITAQLNALDKSIIPNH